MKSLEVGLPRLGGRSQVVLVAICLLSAGMLWVGFKNTPAPPHIHDAANHAFFVERIASQGVMDHDEIWEGLPVRPVVPYFVGWHAAAAQIAQLGGVAPYVSSWFTPLFCLVWLPLSLTLLWRALGIPVPGAVLGALLVVANQYVPASILGWGGFGQIVGMYLVSFLVLLMRGIRLTNSLHHGALFGLLLFGLMQIHAGEIVVVLLFGWLTDRTRPVNQAAPGFPGRAFLGAVGCFLAAAVPPAWNLAMTYARHGTEGGDAQLLSLRESVARLIRTGGSAGGLIPLCVTGVSFSLLSRKYRTVAVVSILSGVFYLLLASVRDPVTSLLSVPFYRQAARISYLQMFVLPPLMAFPLLKVFRVLDVWWKRSAAVLVSALLMLLMIFPGFPAVVKSYRNQYVAVPFSAGEYEFARRIAPLVEEDAVVANFWDDGSTWAAHVSGTRFLLPCAWPLLFLDGESSRPALAGLAEPSWSARTRALADLGVRYLYVSDDHWQDTTQQVFQRETFAADPRFTAVLAGNVATLYRIDWEE